MGLVCGHRLLNLVSPMTKHWVRHRNGGLPLFCNGPRHGNVEQSTGRAFRSPPLGTTRAAASMRTGPTLEVENIMGYDPVECKARAKRDLEAGNLFPRQLSGDMQQ